MLSNIFHNHGFGSILPLSCVKCATCEFDNEQIYLNQTQCNLADTLCRKNRTLLFQDLTTFTDCVQCRWTHTMNADLANHPIVGNVRFAQSTTCYGNMLSPEWLGQINVLIKKWHEWVQYHLVLEWYCI